jgi:branched-chain amino acid transport system permease protein
VEELELFIFGVDPVQFLLYLAAPIAWYLPVAISLNLELGYGGIPNFGKALLVAVGGLVAGSLVSRFSFLLLGVKGDFMTDTASMMFQVNNALSSNVALALGLLLLTLILAAAIGAFVGYVASYPAIRLREDYLAMTLLAMAEFFIIFARNYTPLVTGAIGIPVPNPFAWAGVSSGVVATFVLVLFALLTYLYAERVARSPLGRALRAIRDNENASEALGKDTVSFRRNVLIAASMISAMAGCLYGFYVGHIAPDDYPRFTWTIIPWVMVIVGGAANNLGVAVGVILYELIFKVIDYAKYAFLGFLPFDPNYLQYLTVGVLLTVILIYRPEGILKEKSTATLGKARIQELMNKLTSSPRAEPEAKPPSDPPIDRAIPPDG